MAKDFIISLQDLLKGRNEEFDKTPASRIRLIRHKDNRKPDDRLIDGKVYENSLFDLYLNDHDVFLSYQSEQLRKKFVGVDFIVSFIGEEGVSSRFVGVFRNNGVKETLGEYNGDELVKIDFQEIDGFEPLKEKVIMDWRNPVSWCQNYGNEMFVTRIDRGIKENNLPVFTRFEDVLLDYNQLKRIFETSNSEWKSKLESCNCIYLILDKKAGKHYIGSTYNNKGIWGRWEQYAKTGHGGDKSLIPLLQGDPEYAKNFQWCILETLPLKIVDQHAIDRESLYKRKFGTREFGYNNN